MTLRPHLVQTRQPAPQAEERRAGRNGRFASEASCPEARGRDEGRVSGTIMRPGNDGGAAELVFCDA